MIMTTQQRECQRSHLLLQTSGFPRISALGNWVNRGNPRPNSVRVHLSFQRQHATKITICAISVLYYIFTKSIDNLIVYGHAVSAEEVEAKNFVLYLGHLWDGRELVVQPTTHK